MVKLAIFWFAITIGAWLAAFDASSNQPWRQAFAVTIVALHLITYMWILPHVPIDDNKTIAQVIFENTIFSKAEIEFNNLAVNLAVLFWFPLQAAFALALSVNASITGLWFAIAIPQTMLLFWFAYDRRSSTSAKISTSY